MDNAAGANGGEGLADEAARLANLARELHDAAATFISRSSADEQSLRHRALAIDSDICKLRYSVETSLKNAAVDAMVIAKVEEELDRARYALNDDDAASFLPSKAQGRFLKMFLGPVNVRATRKEVQLKVKEEYNNYRDRTAILFLLFPSILLILRSWIWEGCLPTLPFQLYQAWLLFLYTSLALRENILRENGSDIRPWWIYHHYCAISMALISLTWEIKGQPDCTYKQRGVQLFLAWAIMQGVAMLLQNRYQRQRLYTRIALGKTWIFKGVFWSSTLAVEVGEQRVLFSDLGWPRPVERKRSIPDPLLKGGGHRALTPDRSSCQFLPLSGGFSSVTRWALPEDPTPLLRELEGRVAAGLSPNSSNNNNHSSLPLVLPQAIHGWDHRPSLVVHCPRQ